MAEDSGWITSATETADLNIGISSLKHHYDATTKTLEIDTKITEKSITADIRTERNFFIRNPPCVSSFHFLYNTAWENPYKKCGSHPRPHPGRISPVPDFAEFPAGLCP